MPWKRFHAYFPAAPRLTQDLWRCRLPPNNELKEIALDFVATCAEIPNFAANKTEMSHGVIE